MNLRVDHSGGREVAVKFLYQLEVEKNFYFDPMKLDIFFVDHHIHAEKKPHCVSLVQSFFENQTQIDEKLSSLSENWKLYRMAIIDRSVLRLALAEMLLGKTPPKVVINEFTELAKVYGTEQSSAFVNAILDASGALEVNHL